MRMEDDSLELHVPIGYKSGFLVLLSKILSHVATTAQHLVTMASPANVPEVIRFVAQDPKHPANWSGISVQPCRLILSPQIEASITREKNYSLPSLVSLR
jgi:hypothetical protein